LSTAPSPGEIDGLWTTDGPCRCGVRVLLPGMSSPVVGRCDHPEGPAELFSEPDGSVEVSLRRVPRPVPAPSRKVNEWWRPVKLLSRKVPRVLLPPLVALPQPRAGFSAWEVGEVGVDGPFRGELELGSERVHLTEGFFPPHSQDHSVIDNTFGKDGLKVQFAGVGSQRALANLEQVGRKHLGMLEGNTSPGARRTSDQPVSWRLRKTSKLIEDLGFKGRVSGPTLGALLRGWKDLPLESLPEEAWFLKTALDSGAKFLSGGTLKTVTKEDGDKPEEHTLGYVRLALGGAVHTIFPRLVAKLTTYTTYRVRDHALVMAARQRAIEWYKKYQVPDVWQAVTLASCVLFGVNVNAHEDAGALALDQVVGRRLNLLGNWWKTKSIT